MRYTVYILHSRSSGLYYKGYSTDLRERLERHHRAKTGFTSRYHDWKLVFYCVFAQQSEAQAFERYLKTASGIAFLKKRLVPNLS